VADSRTNGALRACSPGHTTLHIDVKKLGCIVRLSHGVMGNRRDGVDAQIGISSSSPSGPALSFQTKLKINDKKQPE
jgi:hypothetical protein